MAFDSAPARDAPLSDAALGQLFTEARTRNGWSDRRASPGGACEPGYDRLRPR